MSNQYIKRKKMSVPVQLQSQTVTVKKQEPYAIYPNQFFKKWIIHLINHYYVRFGDFLGE